jgi:cell wall-associated NlpC family hydrolase
MALAATLCTGRAQQPILQPFYSVASAESAIVGGFRFPAERDDLPVRRALPALSSEVIPRAVPVSVSRTVEVAAGPTISGSRAVIRHGLAYAPADAPEQVKRAIWAINRIVGRRYKWGGGHASFADDGYDCSGTVSYALHSAGLLDAPLASAELTRFGSRGSGRWITVYARRGHTFAVIAGLRLDTTDLRYGGDVGPRWHEDGRDTSEFEARHAVGA